MKVKMNSKWLPIQHFFITFLLISTNFILIATPHYINQGDESLADLQLETFDVWWSEVNNGTIFIRYIVNNTGETFRNEFKPIRLNISFKLNLSSNGFAFVDQASYIDPYAWYAGEKLSGCIHTPLKEKPALISAKINADNSIPESNITNNVQQSDVLDGIHLYGYVFKKENDSMMTLNDVSLKRCDSGSLTPSLSIRFDTNNAGFFNVVLYPNKPLNKSSHYHLLVSDKNSSQVMYVKTPRITSDDKHFFNITFQGVSPDKPNKPRGPGLWLKNIPSLFISMLNTNTNIGYYKVKWKTSEYSDWFRVSSDENFLFLIKTWDHPGLKSIKIIAITNTGLLSEWSDTKLLYII